MLFCNKLKSTEYFTDWKRFDLFCCFFLPVHMFLLMDYRWIEVGVANCSLYCFYLIETSLENYSESDTFMYVTFTLDNYLW